jgi:antitoxin VapB
MGLNIKNDRVEALIGELAALTGEGKTEAVEVAVRERIERLNEDAVKQKRLAAIMEIAKETGPLLKGFDWDEELYGENGLYDRETGLPK